MSILELRLLPPLAVGRLGASPTPLEAYRLKVDPKDPLGFRDIVPEHSLEVDPESGAIGRRYLPEQIRFKEPGEGERRGKGPVRPVAPFIEAFVVTDEAPDTLVPLTLGLLERHGLGLSDLRWSATVGNIKIFRRTGDPGDRIIASVKDVGDHHAHPLLGDCANFYEGRQLPLGHIRFIRPTADFPEIRLRFTPAEGRVYGSSRERVVDAGQPAVPDPIIDRDELVLYDPSRGRWRGYTEPASAPTITTPPQIYAGYANQQGNQVSWGYLDDECDGFVRLELNLGERCLVAQAHIGAGPPAYAPDSLPPRAASDELEQILLGPTVQAGEVTLQDAEDVVRRAFESVRLMNVAVMNGNAVDGELNTASTMVRQDTNDFGRLYAPIMATSIVDTLAVRDLHQRVYGALAAGRGPWFADSLRRPTEIGDLSDSGRRKMPGLMRNADGRGLCLTWRMIDMVVEAASLGLFGAEPVELPPMPEVGPVPRDNLVAQLHHRGEGNPSSVLPRAAISNCYPGLEYDFRNLWRRALLGITLMENNNVVESAEGAEHEDLVGRRLLAVQGRATMVVTTGPVFPNGDSITLATQANPNAVSFLEWSNSLAEVLQHQGEEVDCEFTAEAGAGAATEVLYDVEKAAGRTISRRLQVRRIFDGDSAAFSEGLLEPGELTQGLCSPWQNDYRECACYYWAASRPDYVNVEPGTQGLSHGDSWMSKERTGTYIPDNRTDSRLLSYDDLFRDWQGELRFIIGGKDAEVSGRGRA